MIDRRLPVDEVPEEFLKEMIRWADNAIELIDKVLEPLEQVKQVVFYSCLGSWAALFIFGLWKTYECDVSRFVEALEEGGFNKNVAEVGKCDDVYPEDDQRKANENCNDCTSAIENYNLLRSLQRNLCDRIFCISAPTLRKYIEDSKTKDLLEIPELANTYQGPSCKMVGGKDAKAVTADDIEKVYGDYKNLDKASGDDGNKCSDLHPADAECCGQEYMDEYGTVCGIGQEGFYNEIKESVCREKQAFNRDGKSLSGSSETVNCHILGEAGEAIGGVLDTFASILRCEPGAKASPTLVNSQFRYKASISEFENSDDKKVYFRIKQSEKEDDKAEVWRGYTTKAKKINANAGNAVIHTTETFVAAEKITSLFAPEGKKYESGKAKFRQNLQGVSTSVTYSKAKADALYEEIRLNLGYDLQDILVDPTSGFLRSIQCLCLSAITEYLNHYKTILQMVRNCFAQIIITGSGSEGVCEAVLSMYVCDFIYEIINCVTRLIPSVKKLGGERGGTFSDISSFISALGTAASTVSDDIKGRYGDQGMYSAMFNERKLINSICMWAFTGTWDMNFEAMLEAGTGVTVNSTGFIYPCERRFITPNPISTPPGLAKWNYHIGIGFVAGADLRYTVKLKCSDGYTCDASDGFTGGRCDCVGKGDKSHPISGNIPGLGDGTLSKGESIGTGDTGNIYYQVEAPVRYDTAILEWSYKNNQGTTVTGSKDCEIDVVGAQAPGYCQFDLGTGMFRCGIGIQEEHWARFVAKPSPAYPAGKVGFGVDDTIGFTVNVNQKLPATTTGCIEDCAWTKYLTYQIKTHTGKVIANNTQNIVDPKLKMNTDGESVLTVPNPALVSVKTGRHHFAPQTGAGSFSFRVLTGDPEIGPVITPLPGVRAVTSDRYWMLEFDFQANNDIDVKMFSAIKGTGVDNYTKGNQIGSAVKLTSTKNDITFKSGGKDIAFISFVTGGKPGSDTNALLTYHAPTTTDTCGTYLTTPATWYATFTMWDSRKLRGNVYERSETRTIDPNGKVQEYLEIPFKVYCTTDVPNVTVPAAPAQPVTPAPVVPAPNASASPSINCSAMTDCANYTDNPTCSLNPCKTELGGQDCAWNLVTNKCEKGWAG
jgi:hypothetical protein